MTTEFKKQMVLTGPKKELMEVCISYFQKLGYEQFRSDGSSWVEFKKTISRWRATQDDIGRSHFLMIQLDSITQNKTNAVFHFETMGLTRKGHWNTNSVQEAESLLTHLQNLLALKFGKPMIQSVQPAHPTEREKVVEREVVVKVKCRYCGALNDQMARKCVSCGGPM